MNNARDIRNIGLINDHAPPHAADTLNLIHDSITAGDLYDYIGITKATLILDE